MKTFLSPSSTRTPARSSGFTLIEVLVALVILLIGGLAIMNLFPPAFNVVKGSENREVAMAQVKGTLARYSNDPASIPDAIYDRVGNAWNDRPLTAVEGSRTRNFSLPNTLSESDFADSALGNFKHIVGERHKVISYTDTAAPPVTRSFVLLNHAYAYTAPMATAGNPKVSTAETIEGARVDANGKLYFDDAVYASDGTPVIQPLPAPQQPQAGIYYASYAWQNTAGGPLQSITDELVDMTPDPVTGDIKVFHRVRVVAGPIEMKALYPKPLPLLVPPIPVDAEMAFRGFLPVDPALKGKEVVVDYDVLDWRWLVEDTAATVSTIKSSPLIPAAAVATARDVKLSVPALGAPQPTPVVPPSPAPTPTPDPDLYALAMPAPDASNQIYTNALGDKWRPTVGGNGVVLDVSAASATYDVDDGTGTSTPMIAPRVRTSYWTSKGWAQQLSVAASSYYVFDGARPAAISEKWREFYWRPGDGKLYFHPSEAGKTIMVSFTSGTTKYSNRIVTISSRITSTNAITPAPTTTTFPNLTLATRVATNEFFSPIDQVAVAELTDSSGNPILTADSLTSIRGVSVRARTAWQQGSDYTQEVAEMYRPLN